MTFLEIVGLTWIALWVWNFSTAYREVSKESSDAYRKMVEAEVDKAIREVYIEDVNSGEHRYFLVYDAKTHNYIAQGRDREEVKANIQARYPNTVFVINNENLEKING
jgi:hypothetical protein